MRIITKSDKIANISDRWRSQYPKDKCNKDQEKIYKKLLKLPDDVFEDEIEEIIGNRSWTHNFCYECEKDVFSVIEIGAEPDYGSATTEICLECLEIAVSKFALTG